jgi:hypothetical protein
LFAPNGCFALIDKNVCKITVFGLDDKKIGAEGGIMVLGNGVFAGGCYWLAFADDGWYWV